MDRGEQQSGRMDSCMSDEGMDDGARIKVVEGKRDN